MTQPSDRERDALVAIVDAILADRMSRALVYYTPWTYRVTATKDGPPVLVSAKAQDPRVPDITDVAIRPGPDGGYSTPPVGSEIVVRFLNADPSRPYIDSLDPNAISVDSWLPIATKTKMAGGGHDAARVGDHVHGGYVVILPGGLINVGGSSVNGFYPATTTGYNNANTDATNMGGVVMAFGNIGPPSTGGGVITDGSSKVEIGP